MSLVVNVVGPCNENVANYVQFVGPRRLHKLCFAARVVVDLFVAASPFQCVSYGFKFLEPRAIQSKGLRRKVARPDRIGCGGE